jgi:hypothetical protein
MHTTSIEDSGYKKTCLEVAKSGIKTMQGITTGSK